MVALPELKGQRFGRLLDHVYNTGETYVDINIPIILSRDEIYYRNYSASISAISRCLMCIKSIPFWFFGYEVTEQMIAKKRIEESGVHFRWMADLIPAKISNADEAGGVTNFNKTWLEYRGMSFDELKDFGYPNIIHPYELEAFQTRFRPLLKREQIW